MSRIY